ncbi:hypothetical protein NA56DRAFT_706555 [Hyaloscypha hepaticicola]|uniref:Uncharacterized protein n=1 Tax=Hyaloscypha hepaticicola TaxID=2082293 RepID=A0A2J6PX81_9HELO|nr:hypothetical protein NA56DRAFT_706555 [Hyaloscypha hepaticicola]
MLLFALTLVGVEGPTAAKPIEFVANSASLSSAPFLEFFWAFQTFEQFLAETLRDAPRSRLLLCPALHYALAHVSNNSLRDLQSSSYDLYQSTSINCSQWFNYFYSFIVNAT